METAHEGAVWSLAWHPLGHMLASGSNDCTRYEGTKVISHSLKYGDPYQITMRPQLLLTLPRLKFIELLRL